VSRLELSSVAVSGSVRWTLEQVAGRRRLSRSQDRRDFEEIPLKSAEAAKTTTLMRRCAYVCNFLK
jgi:hypothetical protein